MGSLAIHFTGMVNTNVKLDVTVTAQGASPDDETMDVRVISITQSGDGYLVNYEAGANVNLPRAGPQPGASGWVFLKPGQPVTTVKSPNTDVTLTLTE